MFLFITTTYFENSRYVYIFNDNTSFLFPSVWSDIKSKQFHSNFVCVWQQIPRNNLTCIVSCYNFMLHFIVQKKFIFHKNIIFLFWCNGKYFNISNLMENVYKFSILSRFLWESLILLTHKFETHFIFKISWIFHTHTPTSMRLA